MHFRLTYTYELQKALVRTDERPVILIGTLDDIIALDSAGTRFVVTTRV